MKRSLLSLAVGIVALATVVVVRHAPRAEEELVDHAELDALRDRGAI